MSKKSFKIQVKEHILLLTGEMWEDRKKMNIIDKEAVSVDHKSSLKNLTPGIGESFQSSNKDLDHLATWRLFLFFLF